eukprot:9526169-Lingulodinium_polyedra.AAC.1
MHEDSDEDGHLFIQILSPMTETNTNVFSIVAPLRYGYNISVDLIDICGGAGRISQAAFSRGL